MPFPNKTLVIPARRACVALLAVVFVTICGNTLYAEPVPIILDVDMESDVDDVGALALLHALGTSTLR